MKLSNLTVSKKSYLCADRIQCLQKLQAKKAKSNYKHPVIHPNLSTKK